MSFVFEAAGFWYTNFDLVYSVENIGDSHYSLLLTRTKLDNIK